jgi:hypothetical protein
MHMSETKSLVMVNYMILKHQSSYMLHNYYYIIVILLLLLNPREEEILHPTVVPV